MPRVRFLQKALRKVKPPQPMPDTVKTTGTSPVKEAFNPEKAQPEGYSKYSQHLFSKFESSLAENKPHFTIGGKEVYFPWEKITLLRNTGKMTPYQAQFQVPLHFNKLDLRDYLWHIYGLRALNITTQLKWSEWVITERSRYRSGQFKKMIIDMEEPFLWPEEDEEALKTHEAMANRKIVQYSKKAQMSFGSDKRKTIDVSDGIFGPYPDPPQSYVPKDVEKRLENLKTKASKQEKKMEDDKILREYLKL